MKTIKISLLLGLFSLLQLACIESEGEPSPTAVSLDKSLQSSNIDVMALPYTIPNETQTKALQFMREEEKLARDVYNAMFNKYSLRTFQNISSSEQTHTNAIKTLLVKYNIDDPIKNDVSGIFVNTELQKLYEQLIKQGNISEVEALKVGAAIEEIDIIDLGKHIQELQNNEDISAVYTNLKNASYNHLKAFVRNLSSRGINYNPIYLSEDEYNSIIR